MTGQTAALSAIEARKAAPGSPVVRSMGTTKLVSRVVVETAIIFKAITMAKLMTDDKRTRFRVCEACGLQCGISGRKASAKARPESYKKLSMATV